MNDKRYQTVVIVLLVAILGLQVYSIRKMEQYQRTTMGVLSLNSDKLDHLQSTVYRVDMKADTIVEATGGDPACVVQARQSVNTQEARAEKMERDLRTGDLSQGELNMTAQVLYEGWETARNTVWDAMKQVLPPEELERLDGEEETWLAQRAAAVAAAGAEVEGGTLYPLVTNQKAAELTKEHVYELLELLK